MAPPERDRPSICRDGLRDIVGQGMRSDLVFAAKAKMRRCVSPRSQPHPSHFSKFKDHVHVSHPERRTLRRLTFHAQDAVRVLIYPNGGLQQIFAVMLWRDS